MQFNVLFGAFAAILVSGVAAAPSPQDAVVECASTCSTDCVMGGNLRGGICSSDGTCTCLTGLKGRSPEPQAGCWSTVSYSSITRKTQANMYQSVPPIVSPLATFAVGSAPLMAPVSALAV
jgi:hypothetical protein